MEEWRPCPGYEGFYEVSDRFRIMSLHPNTKGLIMSIFTRGGYESVILSKNGVANHHAVHRLVALAFIPNRKNKPLVIFKDGNRKNLSLDNIKWATLPELNKLTKSSERWREIIPKIRGTYSPDLLRELNETFILAYA